MVLYIYIRVRCPIFVQRAAVREYLCNYCATRISTVYRADVRPSRALTMERLADLRPCGVPPGSGQTNQHKRVSPYSSSREQLESGSPLTQEPHNRAC